MKPLRSISVASVAIAVLSGSSDARQQATFEDVVRDLAHRDARVRISAIRALREGGHPQAIEPIARLIGDAVDSVQLEAIAAIVSFYAGNPAPVRRKVAGFIELRGARGPEAAFLAGPYVVAPLDAPAALRSALIAALQDNDARVKTDALYGIGIAIPPPAPRSVTDPVVPLLGDDAPPVRTAAARVLGRLHAEAAGDALIQAMNDPSSEVRLAATTAVSEVHDLRAADALRQQYEYFGRGREALVAFEALSRLGHTGSIPIYSQRLRDSNAVIRGLAAAGLGRARATASMQELESAVQAEPDLIARLGMFFALQLLDRPYAPQLVEALGDDGLRAQAFAYLVELGPAGVQALQVGLEDQRPVVRIAAADALGFTGNATTTAALEKLRQDPDPLVAFAAARAVERIRVRFNQQK